MPVKIPRHLPAFAVLQQEEVFVMDEERALHQDIRPLKIVIMNLMPNKSVTETQLLRLLANTPLQVEITLLHPVTHRSKNTSEEYLKRFYTSLRRLRREVRRDDYYRRPGGTDRLWEVDYWPEPTAIMDWTAHHVFSTMYICWASQAASLSLRRTEVYQGKEALRDLSPGGGKRLRQPFEALARLR